MHVGPFSLSYPAMRPGGRPLSVNCPLAKQNWCWRNNGETINGQQCKITSVVWSLKTKQWTESNMIIVWKSN